jgi:hypothetical protein
VAPIDGVITRWRVRNVEPPLGPLAVRGLALRVLRANGAPSFTGAGTSGYGLPQGNGVETFATRLPVSAGEYVALDDPEGMGIGVAGSAGMFSLKAPPPPDGIPASFEAENPSELTYNFDLLPVPTVSALAAAQGATANETVVGISGTSFEEVEAVTFGGASFGGIVIGGLPASSYEVRSEHLVTAVVPAGASSGRLSVGVTTPAGTATGSFDYVAPTSPAAPVSASAPTAAALSQAPSQVCIVPPLRGRRLKASKQRIRAADCKVGALVKRRGATARTGKVVKQVPKPGVSVPAGTKVKVTLAQP